MTTRRRRVRVTRDKAETGVHPSTDQLKKMVDDVIKLDATAVATAAKKKALLISIKDVMDTNQTKIFKASKGVAEIVTPKGNASNVIDPKKFREAVKDDDDFYSATTIAITKAKKVMPEKALTKITTTTPAAAKDPVLAVRARTEKD